MDIAGEVRQLFGGAMQAVLPARWRDMSDFVPIPDNQEVFNDSQLDATAVIEILERVDQPDPLCISYLFLDLARNNEADEETLHKAEAVREVRHMEAPGLQAGWPKYVMVGEQWVKPDLSPTTPRDHVKMILFLVRIPEAETDLLVSFNLPHKSLTMEEFQGAYGALEAAMQRTMLTLKVNDMHLFVN